MSNLRASYRTAVALCIVVFVVLSVTVIGCKKETPPALPTSAPIPEHFTTYTDKEGLFSISYPSDWELLLHLLEGVEEAIKDVITSIEADAPVERFSSIFAAGKPTVTGYLPNVVMGVESMPGIVWTHDRVVEAQVQGIETMISDFKEFSREKIKIDGRNATLVEYEATFPGQDKSHQLMTVVLVGKTAWLVTCTPPPGEFDKFKDEFHEIVKTLRIHK